MTTSLFATVLARSVPRYTSYPPALQFHPGVTGKHYAAWLSGMPRHAPVSLYIHIPYCRQLCWYCACHTRVANDDSTLGRYRDALIKEISLVRDVLGFSPTVSHLHWGGGTPTTLSAPDFQRIHESLKASFTIGKTAEIAVEIDPRTLSEPMIDALAATGVSRVSFGVQDFDPQVQSAINRIQSFATTRRAVEQLRNVGIASVNIDLVYGLPLQTIETVRRTIDLTLDLRPDRVALFGYAHVPWLKRHQELIQEADLPNPEARWQQAQAAAQILVDAGYERIGIDHFALPSDRLAQAARTGALRRNFQGYTDDLNDHLIGVGASSISSFPAGYVQNTSAVPTWLAQIESGQLAIARGVILTDEDRLRRDIIERLMCHLFVDLAKVLEPRPYLARAIADAFPALQQLECLGIAILHGSRVEVAPAARPLARVVASTFDAYASTAPGRHSAAV